MADVDAIVIAPGIDNILLYSVNLDPKANQPQLHLNRILAALLVRNSGLVKGLVAAQHDIVVNEASFLDRMQHGDAGQVLDKEELFDELKQEVAALGKTTAFEKDFARLILRKSGIPLVHPANSETPLSGSLSNTSAQLSPPSPPDSIAQKQLNTQKVSRSVPKISTLLEVGRDLTREAREGKLLPVVGRERELQEIIETLCRRTKRNPVLVGPAGVGKTAIVEGLAQQVVNLKSLVPDLLRDVTIILLQPSLIVAGAGQVGAIEKRMKSILAEAAQEGIILFIDEVHCIVGAGGTTGTGDVASLMKPALARGDIACIAATTDDEYRRFIEQDAALERRFNVVRVQEMTFEEAFEVLKTVRDDLQQLRGVSLDDTVLLRLMNYAAQYMRNRTFPDKGIDLLEQCIANALARGDKDVDLCEADNVVQRKFGIPIDLENRLDKVRHQLALCSRLKENTINSLLDMLNVSMRGLDSRDVRPNAVLLLTGTAAREGENIAGCLSSALFENPSLVVKIDLGRMLNPSDITLLLGSPPSYVGHGGELPIHRIKQFPWCIVLLENIDKSGPHIQQVVAQAFKDGYFVDGQSRKIFLSDVIVLLTARGIDATSSHTIGFGRTSKSSEVDDVEMAKKYLDAALVDTIDQVVSELAHSVREVDDSNVKIHMLENFAARYGRQGLKLHCDHTLLSLFDDIQQQNEHADLELILDKRVGPLVIAHFNEHKNVAIMCVRCHEGKIIVEGESE
jgi:ATP-dependent Clp protease ATP-binding subunit ClpC